MKLSAAAAPGLAGLYSQNVAALARALEYPERRAEPLRRFAALLDATVLTPTDSARNSVEMDR